MTRSLSLMACAICGDSSLPGGTLRALGYLDVEQTSICADCADRIRRAEPGTAPADDPLPSSPTPFPYFPPASALEEGQLAALLAVLADVDLANDDHGLLSWLARWDQPTTRALVGLLSRTRTAATASHR